MANKTQLKRLEEGVDNWNKWRQTNRNRKINLSGIKIGDAQLEGVNLAGADLEGADFANSNLNGADLSDANLKNCSLFSAELRKANLNGADLSSGYLNCANLREAQLLDANLSYAYLVGASLQQADLSRSRLRHANLIQADFSGAQLHGAEIVRSNLLEAIFTGATMAETTLTQLDLSTTVDLEWVVHHAPCQIDDYTLGHGVLPEAFLRGCGLQDDVIETLVDAKKPAKLPSSCFISYAEADVEFAVRLHDTLQSAGIRCWMTPEKSESVGKLIIENGQLNRVFDKLVLVVSKNSLSSEWIEQEVTAVLARESAEEDQILLPIALDNSAEGFNKEWFDKLKKQHDVIKFINWNEKVEFVRALAVLMKKLK